MKLKITITGQEVHNVGYRFFLFDNAVNLGISGFRAFYSMKGDVQAVVALIEGSVKAVEEFKKMVERKKPERALVSSIAFEEIDVNIMRIEGYAQYYSTVLLNRLLTQW
jgi:acylphosphatase